MGSRPCCRAGRPYGSGSATGSAGSAGPSSAFEQRIDIHLMKAGTDDFFATVGQMTGMTVVLDPQVRKNLTLSLEGVRLRVALDAACDSLRCRWSVEEGQPAKLVITALPGAEPKPPAEHRDGPPSISLRVADANVRDLVKHIAEALGAGVDLDPAFAGKVSLSLRDTPWNEALNTLCERAGCDWSLQEESGKKVLRVKAKPAGRR